MSWGGRAPLPFLGRRTWASQTHCSIGWVLRNGCMVGSGGQGQAKNSFSYLSHPSMGVSQLHHHREVRGCELKETRDAGELLRIYPRTRQNVLTETYLTICDTPNTSASSCWGISSSPTAIREISVNSL